MWCVSMCNVMDTELNISLCNLVEMHEIDVSSFAQEYSCHTYDESMSNEILIRNDIICISGVDR